MVSMKLASAARYLQDLLFHLPTVRFKTFNEIQFNKGFVLFVQFHLFELKNVKKVFYDLHSAFRYEYTLIYISKKSK